MRRTRSRRLSMASGVVLLLGACGGGDSTTAPTTVPGDAPAAAASTTTPAAAASTSAPTSTSAAVASTVPPSTVPASTASPTTTPATTPTTTPTTDAAPSTPAPSIDELIGTFAEIAHAGGDQEAPHSTRFAFERAVAAGADVLELDVLLTADDVLVVQHDDTVDKTTEATGPVAALTLDEIQALDNAYWFSPACWPCQDRPVDEYVHRGVRTGDVDPPAGFTADDFRVPTFREIAEAFPELPLDIEIKGSGDEAVAVAERLAAEIAELDRTDSVVVVSFDDEVVDAFRALAPDVETSPGLQRLTAWFLDGEPLDPTFRILQLPPSQGGLEIVTADLVERIHAEGRVVWVWPDDAATQENEAFYRSLISLGVDGIIAGRPTELAAATG